VQDGGGDWRPCEKEGGLPLICLLLQVLVYLLVWCHDTLHLHVPPIHTRLISSRKWLWKLRQDMLTTSLNTHLNHVLIFLHDTNCQFEAHVQMWLFVYYYVCITGKKWGNYTVYLHGYNDFSVNKWKHNLHNSWINFSLLY
jgi:hypothetical protein